MRTVLRLLTLVAVTALACSGGGGETPGGSADAGQVIAVVDGTEITVADLDAWIKDDWFEDQVGGKTGAAVHEFRAGYLQRMIDEQLVTTEARTRGVEVDALLAQEAATAQVSEQEVAAFYQANQQRMGNQELAQMAPRIRQHLERQKAREAVQAFLAGLRTRYAVEVDFDAPRVAVAASGPSLGPDTAPVTIVEFSDFQCPFCARAGTVVKEIRARYPEQVRIVYRHFPLDSIHPEARTAAEASLCAEEQGKFWEYHDVLFANPQAMATDDLKRYAEELGLDAAAFGTCLAEGRFRAQVERDLQDGRAAGVSGTPAFFVNGRMLGGAQPVEEFVKLIEAELASAAPASS